MLRATLWKEYRDQRLFAVILVVAGGALMFAVSRLTSPSSIHASILEDGQLATWLILAWACGLICGAMLLAGEREAGTQEFLDTLPGNRWRGFAFKLVAGLAVLTAECLVLLAFGGASDLLPARVIGEVAAGLAVAGLLGLAWGMYGGTFGRTVLSAVAVGIGGLLVALVGWWSVFLLLSILAVAVSIPFESSIPVATAVIALTTLTGFAGAAWRYGRVEWRRSRIRRGRSPVPPSRFVRLLLVPLSAGPVVWLAWRQQWRVVAVLAVFAVPMAAAVIFQPLLAWPVASLLIGLLCGITAFAEERQGGHLRFLADQRLPLGRIWAIQVGSRLLAALTLGLLTAVLAGLVIWADSEYKSHGFHVLPKDISYGEGRGRDLAYALWQMGPAAFLSLWLLHGFAFGQLCALLTRKSIVAAAIALMIAAPAAVLWWPGLAGGGLAWWQPLAVPLLAIVLSRLLLAPAASDRLIAAKPIGLGAGSVLLGAAWVAGMFELRVAEVPSEAGDFPAAVAAFEAGLPSPDHDKARELLTQAVQQFKPVKESARRTIPLSWIIHVPEGGLSGSAEYVLAYRSVLANTIKLGGPADAQPLGAWLDRHATGDWLASLRAGVHQPLGMLQDPRLARRRTQFTDDYRLMGLIVCARALQLEARGDVAGSIELIGDALALSRHVASRAPSYHWRTAQGMEEMALRTLQHWTSAFRGQPQFLERAAVLLEQHQAAMPPLTDSILADYLLSRSLLYEPPNLGALAVDRHYYDPETLASATPGYLLTLGRLTPRERQRAERLLLDAFAGFWRGEATAATRLPPPDGIIVDDQSRRLREFWFGWEPEDKNDTQGLRRLDSLITHSWAFRAFEHPWVSDARSHNIELFFLRATRVQIALTLYAAREHRPAAALTDLVPKYLPELPADPFSRESFRYRVSAGESILWEPKAPVVQPGDKEFLMSRDPGKWMQVPAGTGILWSVGPDGNDDGGHKQSLFAWSLTGVPGSDPILLVPPPANR